MTKVATAIFTVLWLLALPIAVLAIGFAGASLWHPSELYEELIHGRLQGLMIRVGLLLYVLSPVLVFCSYRKHLR
jgi:hypothetical protein